MWLASRGKDKESDDDMGTEQFNRDRRLSANLSQRSHRGEKRRSHWEVDEAEAGMSYFSGQDTGSNSSVVSTGTTSTDDDDVSSDDSDVETVLLIVCRYHLVGS